MILRRRLDRLDEAARRAWRGLDADFARSRFQLDRIKANQPDGLPGWAFTRASEGIAVTRAGVLVPFATGVPRRTNRGLCIEPAATNECAHRNANPVNTSGLAKDGNPNATLTVVNDAAALEAAGLHLVCSNGMVFKLDNTLGGSGPASVRDAAAVGTLEARTSSVYWRGAGAGGLRLNPTGATALPIPASYQRLSERSVVPVNETRTWRLEVGPGSVAYFILAQLETTARASSPIVTPGGASATRQSEWARMESEFITRLTRQKEFTLIAEVVCEQDVDFGTAGSAGPHTAACLGTGLTNQVTICREDLTARVFQAYAYLRDATDNAALAGPDHSYEPGVVTRMALAYRDGQQALAVGGRVVATAAMVHAGNLTRLTFGSRYSAGGEVNGYVQRVQLLPYRMGLPALALATRL